MARKTLEISVLLGLLAWQSPTVMAVDPPLSSKPRASVSQKLLSNIERDLQAFLDVVAKLETPVAEFPQAQRAKIFDLHSRAQRNIRVAQLHQTNRPLLAEQQAEQLFIDEYRRFVDGLRSLHRAVVLNEDFMDPLGISLESARRTLAVLQQGKT